MSIKFIQKYCHLSTHLWEARAVNKQRKTLYMKVSGGKTKSISNQLIFWETVLIPFAFIFDLITIFWQKRGVAIFEKEIVSMNNIPHFSSSYISHNTLLEAQFLYFNSQIKAELKSFVRNSKFSLIEEMLQLELVEFNKYKHVNCMHRHLYESLVLISSRAELHINSAKERKLASPKFLIKSLLYFHILALSSANKLDKKAFPIQNKGIPILMNDLPEIL